MVPRFRVDFGVYLLLALGLLSLPLSWLMGAIFAACFHELCHYLAAKALRVSCGEFHIGMGGIAMRMSYMTQIEELIIASAGPLGSFFLFTFIRVYPQFAICALVQGLFNLLPIYPLDGGRILRCIFKERADICAWIEIFAIALIITTGIAASTYFALGIYPILLSLLVTAKAIIRKFPCKAAKLGVQ